ncbi:MAG: histidine--tRNA ligase [Brevinematia bacterium]
MDYVKLKGTYDILPKESDFFRYIFDVVYNEARNYGYKEVNFPIIEYAKLFLRGVGEASDIVVKKEMYIFEDRGHRLIALRPEGTASSVRLYLENNLHMQGYSSKLFYYGPMFRAENPQSGRYRQFYQFGFEYIGDGSPFVDVELILLNYSIFKRLGIENFTLYINSIGCKECRSKYLEVLKSYFSDKIERMCNDCKERYEKNILRILDCKEESCRNFIENAPSNIETLCSNCKSHFDTVLAMLKENKVNYKLDNRLVRGLDYYNRTVFEFKSDLLGAQSSFSAGGRYDYLIKELGGPDVPASGFAIGLERLSMLLEASISKNRADFYKSPVLYVANIGEENLSLSFKIINFFRENGVSTVSEYKYDSLKKHLKAADNIGCLFALFVGEEEIKSGKYTLRRLSDGSQWSLSLDDALAVLKSNP